MLFFTVGLPRSGKSTYCKNATDQDPDLIVISGDDFRMAMHGHEYVPAAEGIVFATMDVAVKALLIAGYDVIIDETCTTEATLFRYLRIDPYAIPVFIETSADECIRRAIAANKNYLVGPIERMNHQLWKLRERWDETVTRLREDLASRKVHDIVV